MDLLKCYLVDDEISAIESLKVLLAQYCPDMVITGQSGSVKEAQVFLTTHEVDVLFLDIRMQGETGFDLMRQLPDYKGSLIFVTAHDEYGLQAIKFSATDYLLKPVNPQELIAAAGKARNLKSLKETREHIAMLVQSFENQQRLQQKKIALPEADKISYVLIDDIICCRAQNSYTTFYLSGQIKIMVSKPIADYELLLAPYGFVRTHQSFLINRNRIRTFKKEDGGYLEMEEGIIAPVSRQRKHLVKNLF